MIKNRMTPEPWLIHFFQRPGRGDGGGAIPAMAFLEKLDPGIAADIHAVLTAVAEAPPPTFSGGGKWEAMHGDMSGVYEIRVKGGGKNHRLFCLLERKADDLGGPSIVCIEGLSKPRRQAAKPREYRHIRDLVEEFRRHRTVMR